MKAEQAILLLHNIVWSCPNIDEETLAEFEKVTYDALDRGIAKRAIGVNWDSGAPKYGRCFNCGETVGEDEDCCSNCGQLHDWKEYS